MWQHSRSSATVGKVKSHFPFQKECVLLQYFWVTTILQAHLPKERHHSSSQIYFACLLVDISHKNSLWSEKCTYLTLLLNTWLRDFCLSMLRVQNTIQNTQLGFNLHVLLLTTPLWWLLLLIDPSGGPLKEVHINLHMEVLILFWICFFFLFCFFG